MDDIRKIEVIWNGRVVFKMIKNKEWVIVVNETIKKPKKKVSAAYKRLRRMHSRSRAMATMR